MTYTSLPGLPFELWQSIALHLSNANIKSYRLACSQFNSAALLRIDRVFLSANPLNIEVFGGIASHDKFCHGVTEIIWDEARLPTGSQRTCGIDEGHELLSNEDEPGNTREWARNYGSMFQEEIVERHQPEEEDWCPRWFKQACNENIDHLRRRKSSDVDWPDHVARGEQLLAQPPPREC
ncbi:unnamed protein product [Penicillium egyptiacum]|uniref:F-box domain-containing protein n=1 Tax=Penicillium egyptiacum TaxID=1303716 RepID=A0A9W4KCY5_9EURO|nr:unnamed protein product [Penicillium egyptiacum]